MARNALEYPQGLGALLLIAVSFLASPAAPASGAQGGQSPSTLIPVALDWSRAAVWDDGLAEVAQYDSTRRVYGKDRAFETTMITVKEDFNGALMVKADPPLEHRSIVSVLKMNLLSRIQTENYPYDYMTSVFVRRDDPRVLVKLAASSHEWCGTTFKEVVTWEGPPRLRFHSYFDGEGDGERPFDLAPGVLLEEQLLLVIRAAELTAGNPRGFTLYDSLITNAAPEPRSRQMIASFDGEEPLATAAGKFLTRKFTVRPAVAADPGPSFVFWVDTRPGRVLVRMTSSDGRSHELKSVSRRNYWTRGPASP